MTLGLFAIDHVLILAIIASTAWSAGRIALRLLRLARPAVPHAITVAIGLACLSQGALLLGMVGRLRVPFVAAAVLVVHVAATRDWRQIRAEAMDALLSGPRALIVGVVCVALALPLLVPTMYPPLGFDQTLYHLPAARAFAANGAVPFLPTLRYPVFPQLAEVLNAAVLLFADDVSTQLVGWLALVTCVVLVFVWTRERSSAAGGWVAAATLAGSPIAFYLASTGYVEPLVALFGLAALYAAERGHRESSLPWILASGLLAGSAAGAKYLGLFFIPAGAFLLLWRESWRITGRHVAAFAVAALVAAAPSYGRLIVYTGNPLFPFYPTLFGGSPWAADEFLGRRGISRLVAASTFLWDMTFRRQNVGAMPPFLPMFVIGLPIALVGAWKPPPLRRLLLVAVGYVLLAPVQAHYFLAIAPLWCVVIGAACASLVPHTAGGRRMLAAVAIVLLCAGEGYAAYRVSRLGVPPVTDVERAQLLARERPFYPAIAFLNQVAGHATIYGVGAENMVDETSGTLLGDFNGPASFARVQQRVRSTGSIAAALDEWHASYLLLPSASSTWIEWASSDPRLQRVFDDGHATIYLVRPASPPS